MTKRPKHPTKELEEVLRSAERQGWTVFKPSAYYKMRCPCGQHQKTMHLTPSNPNYKRNLIGQLKRATCWKEES